MRINKFIALATGLSRRGADQAIAAGRVQVNGQPAALAAAVGDSDSVTLDGQRITPDLKTVTIMLNKPAGYVVSRDGQGSLTVYNLLPPQYQNLKPVGRLDKHSSGLLLLTTDGNLVQELTHPSHQKQKVYEVSLATPLAPKHWQTLTTDGVTLDDGPSKFDELRWLAKNDGYRWVIVMHEGRNRQIRRTFAALSYDVTKLHRTQFGEYTLDNLQSGTFKTIT
jgi:23S rRNA pseudouridine2605 synthase